MPDQAIGYAIFERSLVRSGRLWPLLENQGENGWQQARWKCVGKTIKSAGYVHFRLFFD
jgi:hypothetical protein